MTFDAVPALHVTYDTQHDVLEARSVTALPDARHELAADITLHYCTRTRQVVGVTLRRFLSRFPLAACTLAVEDHGAAMAREYFDKYPVILA